MPGRTRCGEFLLLLIAAGSELHLAVPRALLGLGGGKLAFGFKSTDHIPDSGDILDFMTSGDAAPNGEVQLPVPGERVS